MSRKVIITGGVGVGKTSIIDYVQKELSEHNVKYHIVPEYIDKLPDAVEKLGKYLRKEMPSVEFQQYVLHYYDWYFTRHDIDEDAVVILERGIDDPIVCFSNMDNAKGILKDHELELLREESISIGRKHNIPSYFHNDNEFVFIPVKTIDAESDGRMIASIIRFRPDSNIVIGLYNDDETCYNRMVKRGREGEVEVYTRGYISQFNNIYNKLYKSLMSTGYVDKKLSKYL